MRLKACLNGGRTRAEHPAVPITPAELASAAIDAVAAGAEAVHLHARDRDGVESLAANDVGAAVRAVRSRVRTPIGVSTGLWIAHGDPARRRELVSAWARLPPEDRPDFASVNVSEPGFTELAQLLWWDGIGVEPGVWSVADADALAAVSVAEGERPWLRVLVEVIHEPAATAVAMAHAILARLDADGILGERLLHGEGEACWPLVAHAGRKGLATRIGLEDTLVGPDGAPASDNADLVRRALALWRTGRGTLGPS